MGGPATERRRLRRSRPSWSHVGAILALALATTVASSARASPASVALVHDDNPDLLEQRTLTRLRAELAAAGFDVADVARGASGPREAAESEPPVPGAFATIAIVPRSPDAADIWVADRVTGKTGVRRVHVTPG